MTTTTADYSVSPSSGTTTRQLAPASIEHPPIYGHSAIFEIGLLQFTKPSSGRGIKFRVQDFKLIRMPPDTWFGETQWLERTFRRFILGQHAHHDDLLGLGPEIDQFIEWYLLDETNPDMQQAAKVTLNSVLIPGLQSMQVIYEGTAMVGQIQTWINGINEDLKGIRSRAERQPDAGFGTLVKNLLDYTTIKIINDLFLNTIDKFRKNLPVEQEMQLIDLKNQILYDSYIELTKQSLKTKVQSIQTPSSSAPLPLVSLSPSISIPSGVRGSSASSSSDSIGAVASSPNSLYSGSASPSFGSAPIPSHFSSPPHPIALSLSSPVIPIRSIKEDETDAH